MGCVTEPKIVVGNREHLWWMLVEAAELEHMIMCQYLFAEFSLKSGPEEGLTDEQAEAVGRWRKTISGIAVEEMLHLALVYNLLTSIGGAPIPASLHRRTRRDHESPRTYSITMNGTWSATSVARTRTTLG